LSLRNGFEFAVEVLDANLKPVVLRMLVGHLKQHPALMPEVIFRVIVIHLEINQLGIV